MKTPRTSTSGLPQPSTTLRQRATNGPEGLSAIVASYESLESLKDCLRSLAAQPGVSEIIVVDCSAIDPAKALGFEFPKAQFVHFDSIRTIPELRWAGVEYARAEYVAWLEARMVPSADWAARMLAAQRDSQLPAMIGGPVAFPVGTADPAAWAYYVCEYSDASAPSGANVTFPTEQLRGLQVQSLSPWENELRAAWTSAGYQVALCDAEVEFRPTLDLATATRQRFHYGREFASRRFSGAKRVLYAVLCPAIPVIVLGRLAARAGRSGELGRFAASLPSIMRLTLSWSLGEAVGYWLGPSDQQHIY